MSEVTRYLHAGTLVVATEGITKLYPQAAQYVLASDYDQLKAENEQNSAELRLVHVSRSKAINERDTLRKQLDEARELLTKVFYTEQVGQQVNAWLEANK